MADFGPRIELGLPKYEAGLQDLKFFLMIFASGFLTTPVSVANVLLKTMFPKNSAIVVQNKALYLVWFI
jgi:hypothetical protein